jgi:hypothetical protein
MVLKVQVRFFWVVIPCSVHPEDGGSKTFWSVHILPQYYTASLPRRTLLEAHLIRLSRTVFPNHWLNLCQSTKSVGAVMLMYILILPEKLLFCNSWPLLNIISY